MDFVSYMDDLAGEIGVQPSLLWLFFTDYTLFKKVLWGPVSAYQYRLMGPGKWEGARRAIFTQFDRMYQPLKTRQVWNELSFFYILQDLHKMLNVYCTVFQVKEKKASITGRLFKVSLTILAGAASVYYVHVRNPTTIPTLLSKLCSQTIYKSPIH